MIDDGIIILLGAPGAGKGTQAEKLAKRFGAVHLSTGEILRKAVKKGTRGKEVKEIMESGELVPDPLVSEIVKEWIHLSDREQGYLLDGFPRNLAQAQFLNQIGQDVSVSVVNIQIPEEVAMKRLTGRRYCSNCGTLYNLYYSPPQQEGVCDLCGSDLVQREDDQEEVIRERFRVYRKETEPLVEFYSQEHHYFEVNGNRKPEDVFEEICARLEQTESSQRPEA